MGVLMEGFLVAPRTGVYSFSTQSDDASELWVAKLPDKQASLVKMVELTGCCRKVMGSRKVRWQGTRTYYIRYLVKENLGIEYGRVGMTVAEREYFPIPISMFRSP
eukprot:COSAG01_NODE_5157_length_4446_cov_1.899471_4_plen_106_part_00